jgi:chaperonin cofactor prefoldin
MPIPQNELEQVQIHVQKIAAGLEAVETAMNELGIEDPEAEIAKILEEKLTYDKKLNTDELRNSHKVEGGE